MLRSSLLMVAFITNALCASLLLWSWHVMLQVKSNDIDADSNSDDDTDDAYSSSSSSSSGTASSYDKSYSIHHVQERYDVEHVHTSCKLLFALNAHVQMPVTAISSQ
jgi:hypothetical protein